MRLVGLSPLESLVDRLAAPVLIMDGAGTLRHANAHGLQALERADFLAVRDGRVEIRDARGAADWTRMLAGAASLPDALAHGGSGLSLRVHDDNGRSAVLTAYPLRGLPQLPGRPTAAVFVSYPDASAQGKESLQKLFGLTPAEARLAELLVQGMDLAELREKLQLSRETVKSQLSSLFDKTGTHRQGQFVALCRALASVMTP